jgi:hypothetical protein
LKKKITDINISIQGFNKQPIIFFILWALVNSFFLLKNGIVTTGEAEKYIGQANLFIKTGHLSAANLSLYFTQIALLSFCIKLNVSFAIVVIVQLFFNLLATFCFYRTLLFIFNSPTVALTGTIILLANQPYQEFNTFLQTESLFFSFTLILTCYVISIEKLSFKNFIAIIFSLAVISITRPTGLLFIPPVFVYLFFIYFKKLSIIKKLSLLGAIGFLFLFILNKALASGGEFDFMLPFRDEDIICGLTSLTHSAQIQTSGNSNSIFGLLYYIMHNFSQFARLAWMKTIAFFGLYRSYYSRWHNIYLIIYFYSINIMAIAGISFWVRNHLYKLFYFLSMIFITWLTVMLTCDDWHNRFYLSISPYLIILSLGFIKKLWRK